MDFKLGRWSPLVTFAVLIGALIAFLNDVPVFIDETLPWLGERIRLGPLDPTAWDVVWAVVAAAAGGVSAVMSMVLSRRVDRLMRTSTHRLVEVRMDVSKCACGWWGLHRESERHPEAPETDMRAQIEALAGGHPPRGARPGVQSYGKVRGVDYFGTFWWYEEDYQALHAALLAQGIEAEIRQTPGLFLRMTAR